MDVQIGAAGISWDLAACRGQDASVFFAPSHFEQRREKLAREAIAKSFCARCPLRSPCLEYALETRDPHGVWGGMNEMERRTELRRRREAERGAGREPELEAS